MKTFVFLLSKENLELSKTEALSLTNPISYKLDNNLLIIKSNNLDTKRLTQRLAYTKQISELLFTSNKSNIKSNIKSFKWNKHFKSSFRTTIFNSSSLLEKSYADLIWDKLKNPKVDLKTPKTNFQFIFTKNKVYATKLLNTNNNKFNKRRAHLRPELHPSSLHPKLARCLINLSQCKDNDTILDPFCGSGGILIESNLMKIKSIGYDLDPRMLERANENLKAYNQKTKLKKKDFLKITTKHNYIVADLPYGLNSNILINNTNQTEFLAMKREGDKKQITNFFQNVFKNLEKILKKRAIIVLPDFINYKSILKKTKLKIINHFNIYVHGSLSRNILVLEK